MVLNGVVSLSVVAFALVIGLVSSSFISDEVFHSHGSTGRSLLQAKKNCPVNFEFLNYSIITNQCKGPSYPPKQCCGALLQFACPYTDYINDVTNNCAATMFSYINLYGKYPPGLFASECTGDKSGISCAGVNYTAAPSQSDTSGSNPNFGDLSKIVFGFIAGFGLLVILL